MTAPLSRQRVEHGTPTAQRENATTTARSHSFVRSHLELTIADECTGTNVRSQRSFRDNRNTSPLAPTTALMLLVMPIMRRRSSPSRSFVLAALRALHLDRSHTTTNNAANSSTGSVNMPPPKRLATERDRRSGLPHQRKTPRHNGGPADLASSRRIRSRSVSMRSREGDSVRRVRGRLAEHTDPRGQRRQPSPAPPTTRRRPPTVVVAITELRSQRLRPRSH